MYNLISLGFSPDGVSLRLILPPNGNTFYHFKELRMLVRKTSYDFKRRFCKGEVKMEMNMAILVFFLLLFIYTLVSEIFTVMFRLTGMDSEKARFQVVSMLTNSGFTTSESELILKNPLRRKLARITMLFGYAFTATVVSIAINVILQLNRAEEFHLLHLLSPLLFWGCGFLLLIRTRWVRCWFDKMIESLGKHMISSGKNKNSVVILDYIGEFVLAEAAINDLPELLQGKTIAQAGIQERYAVSVLMIHRSGFSIADVSGTVCIRPKDRLILFGPPSGIRALFQKNN